MEKLPMCRICLVDNVRMFVVADKNLQEMYEKLTNVPFVTEDNRPMLACFVCYAKLKQCYQLQRKCLEAEDLFAQMLNNYELKPLTNRGHSEFVGGFVKTAIEKINIYGQIDSGTIEVEIPSVSEKQCDIVEIKMECQSDQRDELELGHLENSCLDVADIPPHQPESDSEDDVPLMEFKSEVVEVKEEEQEQEVSKKKQGAKNMKKLELEHLDNSCLDVADIPPHHPVSDSEDDVPLMELKAEVVEVKEEEQEQEVSKKKQGAKNMKKIELEHLDNSCLDVADIPPHQPEPDSEDDVLLMEFKAEDVEVKEEAEEQEVSKKKQGAKNTKTATVVKKPKLDTRRTQPEDAITAERPKKEKPDSKFIRTTQKPTSNPGTYFKEPYICDQRSFNRVKEMIQQTRRRIREKPKCNVCQRSFSCNNDLTKHIRIHTGEKPFQCDVCQRSFIQKVHLSEHIIRIHTAEKPHKCGVCQRSFSHKCELTKHIGIHTGETPYKCDVCQRSFSNKGELTKHIRIHTGERPFKCDVCQRSFIQKVHLSGHIRTHTGEKPHKCDVCQRSFSNKGELTKHIRIHTGEKPYKCDVCQHSFSNKCDLTKHIRIHTGEKPYKCDLCLRSFNVKGNLTKHSYTHCRKTLKVS